MTNIVIIDDNENQLNYIEEQVQSQAIQDIHIQKYMDEDLFIYNLHTIPEYSIFFIDIVLNNKNGIDIAKYINTNIRGAIVIFISGYLEKVVDIYDADHYYFIYKPEIEKRLPIALNKAIESLKETKKSLPISLKGKTEVIYLANILYLERQKHTTIIKENGNETRISDKLDAFLDKLPSYFIRCHRSFVINMKHIKEMKRTECILHNGTNIPISRIYQKGVQIQFQEFLMENI